MPPALAPSRLGRLPLNLPLTCLTCRALVFTQTQQMLDILEKHALAQVGGGGRVLARAIWWAWWAGVSQGYLMEVARHESGGMHAARALACGALPTLPPPPPLPRAPGARGTRITAWTAAPAWPPAPASSTTLTPTPTVSAMGPLGMVDSAFFGEGAAAGALFALLPQALLAPGPARPQPIPLFSPPARLPASLLLPADHAGGRAGREPDGRQPRAAL